MLPGRYPSPTPPRDVSPDTPDSPSMEQRTSRSPIVRVHTPTRSDSAERDFTAKADFRKNPRFAQSDSALLTLSSSNLSPRGHLSRTGTSSNQPTRGVRRVSEPLRQQPYATELDSTPTPQQKRRRVSDNPTPPPIMTRDSQADGDGERCVTSTLVQDGNPHPESRQPYGANHSDEGLASEGESFEQGPSNEQSDKNGNDEQRPRSPPRPRDSRDLYEKIRLKLKNDAGNKGSTGIIYILRHPTDSTCGYKIGYTSRLVLDQRKSEHDKKCKIDHELVYRSRFEFEHCARTEKLIHLDINEYKLHKTCTAHGGFHGEWFNVPEKLARETVEKWESITIKAAPYESIMTKAAHPYDIVWNLKPVWRYILDNNTRRPELCEKGELSHDSRRAQWPTLLAPPTTAEHIATHWMMFKANCEQVQRYVNALFWQVATLGLYLDGLLRFHDSFNVPTFTVLLCCAAYSVSSSIELSAGKRTAKKVTKARLRG